MDVEAKVATIEQGNPLKTVIVYQVPWTDLESIDPGGETLLMGTKLHPLFTDYVHERIDYRSKVSVDRHSFSSISLVMI